MPPSSAARRRGGARCRAQRTRASDKERDAARSAQTAAEKERDAAIAARTNIEQERDDARRKLAGARAEATRRAATAGADAARPDDHAATP